jgi:hypothetical protein
MVGRLERKRPLLVYTGTEEYNYNKINFKKLNGRILPGFIWLKLGYIVGML